MDIQNLIFEIPNITKINIIDENGNSITSTDFTDESKNLEVWKALGFTEEDYYEV